jgi:hypothetical protein
MTRVSLPSSSAAGLPAARPAIRISGVRRLALLPLLAISYLALSTGTAFATAPETPINGVAMKVTATTATLEGGVLNPHSAPGEFSEYEYRFRVSATECEGVGERVASGFGFGGEKEAVPATVLTELQPDATYTFCLIEHGFFSGEYSLPSTPEHFTTALPTPVIVSEAASDHNNVGQPLSPGQVRLEGVVNPNDQLTECHFQYGEASVTEHEVPCEPEVLKGFEEQNVAAVIVGLQPGSPYHFQIFAKNGKGEEATGAEQTVIPEESPVIPTAPEPATTAVKATTATLHGVLNPLNSHEVEPGTYEFVYRQSRTECQLTNPSTGLPENEKATSREPAGGHLGEKVHAELSGLLPGATYTFCLVARDQAEEIAVGPAVTFTTEAVAPVVGEESVSDIGSASATLHAKVEPGGAETTYFFEYGPAYESRTPLASAGAGSDTVNLLAKVKELQPETLYHFRVVAINAKGREEGGNSTFSTFPASTSELPDNRNYELVSPLDDGDATPLPGSGQATPDGSAVTYRGSAPPVGGNGNTNISVGYRPSGTNAYLAKRAGSGDGWAAVDIQPDGLDSASYQGFSGDLSVGILGSEQALTPGAPEGSGHEGLYLRNDSDATYQFLDAGASYEGSTVDGSHILVKGAGGLYDSAGGQLYPVSVLPEGGPVISEAVFGSPAGDLERVISEPDGSRIFWTDTATGDLYVRENDTQPDASTVLIAKDAQYMTASKDGSRVLFTDAEHLTTNSTATTGEPDLYEYDIENGALTDLSVDSNTSEHANVVGVLGASEDGTYVYFAAAGKLATNAKPQQCLQPIEGVEPEKADPSVNKCNVYVVHVGEAPKLVAAVATADGEEGYSIFLDRYGDWVSDVGSRSAHVTPDGRRLVFDSIEDLTGFDPEGGQEIYMYDFGTGRVLCVSCNPTGVSTVTASHNGSKFLAEYPHSELPESGSSEFVLRDVSVSGDSVFFDSSEGLVSQVGDEGAPQPLYTPQGLTNVYEWEREGSGESCPVKASASLSGGCIFLLSGGTSSDISFFVDASENGDDVFIETRAQLVPQDHGETFEIYDARVDAPATPAKPECTGTGCQGTPAAAPTFESPSTSTFNGLGNFAPKGYVAPKPKSKPKACKKGQVRSGSKCTSRKKPKPQRKNKHSKK